MKPIQGAKKVIGAAIESTDIDEVKGLGFCVSVAHAELMAKNYDNMGRKIDFAVKNLGLKQGNAEIRLNEKNN
ncbi:hypothetical protein V6C27_02000 [Peptococcaceae bacterium 1198_IL3148]